MANKNEQNNNEEPIEELDMNHLMQVRREKLDKLREAGNDPFKITKFKKYGLQRYRKRQVFFKMMNKY